MLLRHRLQRLAGCRQRQYRTDFRIAMFFVLFFPTEFFQLGFRPYEKVLMHFFSSLCAPIEPRPNKPAASPTRTSQRLSMLAVVVIVFVRRRAIFHVGRCLKPT